MPAESSDLLELTPGLSTPGVRFKPLELSFYRAGRKLWPERLVTRADFRTFINTAEGAPWAEDAIALAQHDGGYLAPVAKADTTDGLSGIPHGLARAFAEWLPHGHLPSTGLLAEALDEAPPELLALLQDYAHAIDSPIILCWCQPPQRGNVPSNSMMPVLQLHLERGVIVERTPSLRPGRSCLPHLIFLPLLELEVLRIAREPEPPAQPPPAPAVTANPSPTSLTPPVLPTTSPTLTPLPPTAHTATGQPIEIPPEPEPTPVISTEPIPLSSNTVPDDESLPQQEPEEDDDELFLD